MTTLIPANTTRPLFHIATQHGVDYSDALQVAWGLKQAMLGQPSNPVWFRPAYDRVRELSIEAYGAIAQHTADFVTLQNLPVDGVVLEKGFVHEGP